MLELLSLFGISSAAALVAGLWADASDEEVDTQEWDIADTLVPLDLAESPAPEDIPQLPQITDYDSEDEMLLVGVEPDYAGEGKVAITEAPDSAGTAVISLDGTAVAEVPDGYGKLTLDGIELVELDNFA